jgi:hypothetical protein
MASSDRSGLRRRFTLLDCAILIAATGAGLALLRVCLDGLSSRPLSSSPGAAFQSLITTIVTCASAVLGCWTLGLLALGLRRPRESLRRLARRPGFVACATATSGITTYLTVCTIQFAVHSMVLNAANVSRIVGTFEIYAGLMVAGAWLSLFMGGRWRPETTWVGWAGQGVGSAWIALILFSYVRVFL